MPNWQSWIEANYKVLAMWAKRWSPEEWAELIAHLALYLEKNWPRFSQIPDGIDRIKFVQSWFKNQVRWQNSDFNKTAGVNNLEETWEDKFDSGEVYEQAFDVLAEEMSGDVKAFIIDLESRFSEFEVEKILKIRRAYLTLTTHEKVLYDLYFTQMLSIRAVSAKLDLPHSSVHTMIVALRKKILNLC